MGGGHGSPRPPHFEHWRHVCFSASVSKVTISCSARDACMLSLCHTGNIIFSLKGSKNKNYGFGPMRL